MVGAVIAMMRGREDIVMFRYRLAQERVLKALTIALLALFARSDRIDDSVDDRGRDFLEILFETTSAFGTVGLSMGLTPDLTVFGKVLISITMFAGRLGPLTLAYALGPKRVKNYIVIRKAK